MQKFLQVLISVLLIIGTTNILFAAPVTYFDTNGDTTPDSFFDVMVGDTFSVDIYIENDQASGLQGAGVQVNFDITQVEVLSATVANPPWNLPATPILDNTGGTANVVGSIFLIAPLTDPLLLLASIEFQCNDVGTSFLRMQEAFPDNDTYVGFKNGAGEDLDAVVDYGSIQVNQIPIPSTILLLGGGLAALLGLRRRKSS